MAKPIPIPLLPADVFDRLIAEEQTEQEREFIEQSITACRTTRKSKK
jgi:hypothetical protein